MPRTRVPAIAIVVLGLASGCASNRPFADADASANAISSSAPAQVQEWLQGIRPATGPASASELVPIKQTERHFKYTLNGDSRESVYRIEPTETDPVTATISLTGVRENRLVSLQRVTVEKDGSMVSTASVVADRRVESRFRPPLPLLDGVMSPGTPRSTTHEVFVADMERPGRITRRGRATASLELVGENTVNILGRQVRCLVVRSSFDATFGPAVVNRVCYQWFEPGVGLQGEYAEETVRTLGVRTETRREWWVALD